MTKFIFYRKASVFTGICSKKGKEKKHLHSYWVNIIYTINLRLFGHCICLKSSANVFWVIQKVFHLRCVASSCWCLNLWRLWNFQYLMNQNISALRTLGYVLKPCCLRETSAISHPSAGHHATFYNKTSRPLDSTASCLHNLLLRPSFIIQVVLNWADEQYFILVRLMLSKNKFYFLIFLKYFFLESKTKQLQLIIFSSRFFFFCHLRWKSVLHIRKNVEKDKHFKMKFHGSEVEHLHYAFSLNINWFMGIHILTVKALTSLHNWFSSILFKWMSFGESSWFNPTACCWLAIVNEHALFHLVFVYFMI